MTTPSRSYQRTTASSLAAETAAERAARNGISPALATSKDARAAVPAPGPPPPALKGAVKVERFPTRRGGKYPFREIAADRGIWKLDPAAYQVKRPESIRAAAWTWAKDAGLKAKVVCDSGFAYVQFTPAGDAQ